MRDRNKVKLEALNPIFTAKNPAHNMSRHKIRSLRIRGRFPHSRGHTPDRGIRLNSVNPENSLKATPRCSIYQFLLLLNCWAEVLFDGS